ncbi:MAG: TlpA disulfide reductase family protein [Beijerinckiaceae bacterium]|nr:TlpA disulfide reductase family protein [Beijerinckiaceae bacterium]
MSEPPENPKPAPARRGLPLAPLIVLAFLFGASLYAFGGIGNLLQGKAGGESAQCRAAQPVAQRLKPLVKGEIAALQVAGQPVPATPVSFRNAAGEPVTLADFKGRAVLLNLWATWCAPCRHEMPALDRLQAELGGADFEVVAVNIDTRNFDKPKQFLDEIKVQKLAYFSDASAKIFQDLKAAGRAFGMPTTLLIDAQGCELAWLAGPAEWASPDALAFIRAALGR